MKYWRSFTILLWSSLLLFWRPWLLLFLRFKTYGHFPVGFPEVLCSRQQGEDHLNIEHRHWTMYQWNITKFMQYRYWKFRHKSTCVQPEPRRSFSRCVVPNVIPECLLNKSIYNSILCYTSNSNHGLLLYVLLAYNQFVYDDMSRNRFSFHKKRHPLYIFRR